MTQTPLRYSEITPEIHAALRILAALEKAYPQHGDRCQRTLVGYDEWRLKSWRAGNLQTERAA